MKILCIGAGNVAWYFCSKLTAVEDFSVSVWARNLSEAGEIAKETGATLCDSLPKDVDLTILAVRDDAISDLSNKKSIRETGQVGVHTSGTVSVEALEGKYHHWGVLYPFQTLTRGVDLKHDRFPIFVDASSKEGLHVIWRVAEKISPDVHHLPEQQRQLLHLAGVVTNNFGNALFDLVQKFCKRHDLDYRLTFPLMNQTVEKAQNFIPREVQTGPAARGDIKTIRYQLKQLEENEQWQELYRKFSLLINPELDL